MSEEKNKLHTLYKPCGKAMKVNDNSLSYAKSIGWVTKAEKDAK